MSRQAPQVRTGARGPEDRVPAAASDDLLAPFIAAAATRDAGQVTVEVDGKSYVANAAGKIVFQGKHGLRITIKGSKRVHDPLSNAVFYTRSYVAVFDQNGLFEADPNLIDEEDGKRIPVVERLVANRYFGIGRDFWLLADIQARSKRADEDALVARVQAQPELLNVIAQRFGLSFVNTFEQAAPPAADKNAEVPPTKEELLAAKAKDGVAPSSAPSKP